MDKKKRFFLKFYKKFRGLGAVGRCGSGILFILDIGKGGGQKWVQPNEWKSFYATATACCD